MFKYKPCKIKQLYTWCDTNLFHVSIVSSVRANQAKETCDTVAAPSRHRHDAVNPDDSRCLLTSLRQTALCQAQLSNELVHVIACCRYVRGYRVSPWSSADIHARRREAVWLFSLEITSTCVSLTISILEISQIQLQLIMAASLPVNAYCAAWHLPVMGLIDAATLHHD